MFKWGQITAEDEKLSQKKVIAKNVPVLWPLSYWDTVRNFRTYIMTICEWGISNFSCRSLPDKLSKFLWRGRGGRGGEGERAKLPCPLWCGGQWKLQVSIFFYLSLVCVFCRGFSVLLFVRWEGCDDVGWSINVARTKFASNVESLLKLNTIGLNRKHQEIQGPKQSLHYLYVVSRYTTL